MTLDNLPPEQAIAIAYAPPADADLVKALLALDHHFGSILRSTSEVMLGQMKIAWWRDQLADDAPHNPGGNELLTLIYDAWGDDASSLIPLADGWEVLLTADALNAAVLTSFTQGRADVWLAYAHRIAIQNCDEQVVAASTQWALADLLYGLSDEEERAIVLKSLQSSVGADLDLPRALRPLTILAGLSRRAVKAGGQPLMKGRMAALAALRLGIFGR